MYRQLGLPKYLCTFRYIRLVTRVSFRSTLYAPSRVSDRQSAASRLARHSRHHLGHARRHRRFAVRFQEPSHGCFHVTELTPRGRHGGAEDAKARSPAVAARPTKRALRTASCITLLLTPTTSLTSCLLARSRE